MLLILTRNSDESIIIDGGIKITILEISGSHVKIGIDAPKEIKVYCSGLIDPQKGKGVCGRARSIIPAGESPAPAR